MSVLTFLKVHMILASYNDCFVEMFHAVGDPRQVFLIRVIARFDRSRRILEKVTTLRLPR